jgi:hypothetical protein
MIKKESIDAEKARDLKEKERLERELRTHYNKVAVIVSGIILATSIFIVLFIPHRYLSPWTSPDLTKVVYSLLALFVFLLYNYLK